MNQNITAQITELRHRLHAAAELSGEEKNTAALITEFLTSLAISGVKNNVGGHGIMAIIESGKPGPTILFRSELDALPIKETNTISYRSSTNGVSHKCGHDGHMAILCGLAASLATEPPSSGKCILVFQPAEETGEGAAKVCNDLQFDLQPDFVFALHNIPGVKAGTIIIKNGSFSAAVCSMIITLKGKATHAAQPETGINPSKAIAGLIQFCDNLNNNDPASEQFRLVTPIHINMGSKAYGTAAGDGELHYTLRCWNNQLLEELKKEIEDQTIIIAAANSLDYGFTYLQEFKANVNSDEAVEIVKKSAEKLNLEIIEKETPFRWGEDFGYFTSKFNGCMFGLGAGINRSDLHNPDYDFPDEILETGVNMFRQISKLAIENYV